nr:hypothetical protein Iba_chr09eCG0420 [Ipomoea batatas]
MQTYKQAQSPDLKPPVALVVTDLKPSVAHCRHRSEAVVSSLSSQIFSFRAYKDTWNFGKRSRVSDRVETQRWEMVSGRQSWAGAKPAGRAVAKRGGCAGGGDGRWRSAVAGGGLFEEKG